MQTNLLSLVQAYKNLDESIFNEYLKYHSISVKLDELDDLCVLVNELDSIYGDIDIWDNFTVGFDIPQIGKEFDLLRFGKKSIINIELKRTSTADKIRKQLLQNRYYLAFLGKEMFHVTYISEEKKFYTLDRDDNLMTVTKSKVSELLQNQKSIKVDDVSKLFKPSDYLVSPFNSTEKFLNEEYFLTQQQGIIKNSIIKDFEKKEASFISIIGEAGTGKTLLTYDIAKEYISNSKRVIVFHCANLNAGQELLNEQDGWQIIPAKNTFSVNLVEYDLIILDEVQRMYPNQLEHVILEVKKKSGNCIFSYDKEQCLSLWETSNANHLRISKITGSRIFQLTKTIRTNREVAVFIKALLNKRVSVAKIQSENIELKYFSQYKYAKLYIEHLCTQGWEMINFTPDKKETYKYESFSKGSSSNAHGVIGQEFDKVIAVIDFYFKYEDSKLCIQGYKSPPYYHPLKMLSQIMTRTRGKLYVIVINNQLVMAQALKLLNG
jgi:DNA replication protein DnaC